MIALYLVVVLWIAIHIAYCICTSVCKNFYWIVCFTTVAYVHLIFLYAEKLQSSHKNILLIYSFYFLITVLVTNKTIQFNYPHLHIEHGNVNSICSMPIIMMLSLKKTLILIN